MLYAGPEERGDLGRRWDPVYGTKTRRRNLGLENEF